MKKTIASVLFALSTLGGAAMAQPASAAAPATPAAPAQEFPWLYVVGGVAVLGTGVLLYRSASGKKPGNTRPAPRPAAARPPAPPPLPNFDANDFLRQAKASFIRMQAAWDKADTVDLGKFTTPQVLAELKAQIGERKPDPNSTEVLTIHAELLGVEPSGTDYIASVKFNGEIKPAGASAAEPFAEVWNMTRAINANTGWKLSGIQQLS